MTDDVKKLEEAIEWLQIQIERAYRNDIPIQKCLKRRINLIRAALCQPPAAAISDALGKV